MMVSVNETGSQLLNKHYNIMSCVRLYNYKFVFITV